MTSQECIFSGSETNGFVCCVTTCLDSSLFIDRLKIRKRLQRDRDVG